MKGGGEKKRGGERELIYQLHLKNKIDYIFFRPGDMEGKGSGEQFFFMALKKKKLSPLELTLRLYDLLKRKRIKKINIFFLLEKKGPLFYL